MSPEMLSAPASDDIVTTLDAVEAGDREPLVVIEPLCEFLDLHRIGTGPLEFAHLGEGHSNVTLAVTRGDVRFVLRRPPRGPLAPSAHDVLREARVIGALQGIARVPELLAVCSEESVIGAPFYLMPMIEGSVLTRSVPADLAIPEQLSSIGLDLVDALVEIHAVDWRSAGLDDLGQSNGYLERQIRRFLGLWDRNRTRDLPQVERVASRLAASFPESRAATVIHGDYRLGNAIVDPAPPARIAAILDWEMCTIGDPLADLGYLCTMWADPDDPYLGMIEDVFAATREPGFPTRAELVERYEQRSGRAISGIGWYEALALWKVAIFMEGNYRRSISGSADDSYLSSFGDGVVELVDRADALTRTFPVDV